MQKLALSNDILMSIDKPARYIGNEINTITKNKEHVAIRFAMCFPDVYEIGMSHLGIQILYDMFNKMDDVWCERVYSPWTDLDQIMREQSIPLFALESQDPIKDFDFLGITIQYEMCYTNILQVLDLSNIPLFSKDRTEDDPIVIGGGPCVINPEPIADFFDLFYIGEGETSYEALVDAYRMIKNNGGTRNDFLELASKIPGIYCPKFYDVSYLEDGTIDKMVPNMEGIPDKIERQVVVELTDSSYPMKPVVPFIKATQDHLVLEIQRGCIRGCRFCQAGHIYRPVREKDKDVLASYAKTMLKNTGHDEMTLSSLSSSDYSKLHELVDEIMEYADEYHTNLSLPSLRIDSFSLDIMNKIQDIRKSSLTFAPEAGSQRLRNVINKGLSEEDILEGAGEAFVGGWDKVKLYFMLGLPTETTDDIQAIGDLANKVAAVFYERVPKEKRTNGKVKITVSTSFFIPKPFTPFQWATQNTKQDFIDKAYITRSAIASQLNQKSIRYNWHEVDASVIEGVLARGDRKISKVIYDVYQKGSIFDAWTEYFKNDVWLQAIEDAGLSIPFYTTRERALDEVFPWDFIDCGVTKEFLIREWNNAMQEKVSPNCRVSCQACGSTKYKGGVCYESKN